MLSVLLVVLGNSFPISMNVRLLNVLFPRGITIVTVFEAEEESVRYFVIELAETHDRYTEFQAIHPHIYMNMFLALDRFDMFHYWNRVPMRTNRLSKTTISITDQEICVITY